jgi:UDP-N-acetyl-D-glucosamine dehydrogenase
MHEAKTSVGIVGLGYVGLPLAVAFAESGHRVIGLDTDTNKVQAILASESYIEDITSERLAAVRDLLHATTRYAELAQVDAIIIAVPTPLTPNREPDLQPLISAGTSLSNVLQRGQLVVLESTTYPGTTRERLAPLLEESGLSAGTTFNLAFSPERIDPGRTDFTIRTTPKVVGGLTPECLDRAVELYSNVCDEIVPVSSPDVAELTKLLENIFRTVNIALVNELAILCDRMGVDIWEVVEAAATKPYGFMSFRPGPGMGGHCLPVDPFYLAWKAREYDLSTEFIELAGEVNGAMPYFCAEKVARALNDESKPVRGSRIAIIGVSYKAGVGDLRESPSLKIMDLLAERGAELDYYDPYVPELPRFGLQSRQLTDVLADADVAVIVTAHPDLDAQQVLDEAPLVVDFRGVTKDLVAAERNRVVRL